MNNDSITKHLREQVASLPNSPGVYQFVDGSGKIIYVGKAKSLKKRVSSYFVDSQGHSAKVRVMVKKIVDIRYHVVNSEQDALLLENSLIKELQPRYNTLLKDDKTYPWLVITNEPFPRLITRRIIKHDGSEYYGPYSSSTTIRTILNFIQRVTPIRTCDTLLLESNIAKGKHRECLQYHLNKCHAPCVGRQDRAAYNDIIAHVRMILRGNIRPIQAELEREMIQAAKELRFEDAEALKQRISAIRQYQAKSIIVSSKIKECDVFSTIIDTNEAFCNFLRIRHGSVVSIYTMRIDVGIDSDEKDVLARAITHIVDTTSIELAEEVLVPAIPSSAPLFDKVTFHVPRRGEKLNLLNFSRKSAERYRETYLLQKASAKNDNGAEKIMEEMRLALNIDRQPRHMECFDNSNIQGTDAVASCVVFRNGKPSRKEYRHFKVKSVVGANDFATMYEIIHRRYSRVVAEGLDIPDLIVIDGGKGQLSSACMALSDVGILDKVNVIGLAKRIEEVFFPGNPDPLYLNRTKNPIKILCYIRDEAHRFAINFHRATHRTKMTDSELQNISGIGSVSRQRLLKEFKSMAMIQKATESELASVIGASKAKIVKSYFANKQSLNDDLQ